MQRDTDLSDDEGLMPDQPAFVGLFRPHIFRSLLHKAKPTTRQGTVQLADRGNVTLPNGPFGVGGVVPIDAPNDCSSDLPIGGQLALFADR